jgi:endoglycosylceramidase
MQRAFDNFWANAEGPDGVPLQTHYATSMSTVAALVADQPYVLGYDTMNEPWPGAD